MNKFSVIFYVLFVSVVIGADPIPLPDIYPSSLPSARVKGMGGAGTSMLGESSGGWWNPSLLAFMNTDALHVSFANENHSSLANLLETEPSILGKHISYFSLSTFQGGISYHPLFSLSYNDSLFSTEYLERDMEIKLDEVIVSLTTFAGSGEKYQAPVIFGINLKYLFGRFAIAEIYRNSADEIIDADADISSGNGYGIDVGVTYNYDILAVSLFARDLLTHVYWSGYDKQILPVYTSAGISVNPFSTMLLVFDVNRIFEKDKPFIYRGGLEYTFLRDARTSNLFSTLISGSPSVRAGTSFKEINAIGYTDISLGLGYDMNGYRIDMAVEGLLEQFIYGGFTYQLTLNMPIIN